MKPTFDSRDRSVYFPMTSDGTWRPFLLRLQMAGKSTSIFSFRSKIIYDAFTRAFRIVVTIGWLQFFRISCKLCLVLFLCC